MASDVVVATNIEVALKSISNHAGRIAEFIGIPSPDMDKTARWGTNHQHMERLQEIDQFMQSVSDWIDSMESVEPNEGEIVHPQLKEAQELAAQGANKADIVEVLLRDYNAVGQKNDEESESDDSDDPSGDDDGADD